MGGHPDRATLVLRFQAARTARDVDAMAAAALGLAAQHQFGTQAGRTPAYLHEAYQLASGSLRVRLAAALARTWVYGSEPARAVPFAAEAVAEAERCADPALLAEALDADLLVHWGPDDLAERLRITSRLEDTVAHLPDVESRMSAHLWRLTTALESLDPVTVQRQLRALDELAGESGSPRARLFAVSRRATRALIAETGRAGEEAAEPDTVALLHELGAHLALQRDDRTELAEQAAAFEQFGTKQGVVLIVAEGARLWLASGAPDRARALLDRLVPLQAVPRDVDWLLTVCVLAEVAAGAGAPDVAADAVELLSPYAGRGVVNAGGVTFIGVVDDYLRMASAALGREEDAARWAAKASVDYQRMGRPGGCAGWARRRRGLLPETDRGARRRAGRGSVVVGQLAHRRAGSRTRHAAGRGCWGYRAGRPAAHLRRIGGMRAGGRQEGDHLGDHGDNRRRPGARTAAAGHDPHRDELLLPA